ncbi:MAG: VanZ family protein [Gammaproteobacteria bacterium]|nr:VanZ family protein [Gammaproteobacteria bacterium]
MSSSSDLPLKYYSLWWWLGWLFVAVIIVLSLMPAPPAVPGLSDKVEHAFAYALLMSWFGQLGKLSVKWIIGWASMGVAIEIMQGLSGYRYFDYYDMVANSTGVLIGWLLLKSHKLQYLFFIEHLVSIGKENTK